MFDFDEGYDYADTKHPDFEAAVFDQADRARKDGRRSTPRSFNMVFVADALNGAWMLESRDHGERHWRSVADTALRLCDETPGADRELAFLFGLFHDSCRVTELDDVSHGMRAARYADGMLADRLADDRRDVLYAAIRWHDRGQVSDDPTVGVCWDADRLQLPRVGIVPAVEFMSTAAGKDRVAVPPLLLAPPSWQQLLHRCARL